MENLKSIIPNSLTSLNLACGCIATLSMLNHHYLLAIVLISVATIADFLDGFVARLLKVQSDLGKELDSLADMVSFGVVPGTILYVALSKALGIESFDEILKSQNFLPFSGYIITVFSALRLAKFNIDTRQSTSFIGLPTPANTLFFITIPLIWLFGKDNETANDLITSLPVLIGITIVFSYLLIAEIPLIALKFKTWVFKENVAKYILILGSIISISILGYLAIPVILILYISVSIIENIKKV